MSHPEFSFRMAHVILGGLCSTNIRSAMHLNHKIRDVSLYLNIKPFG